MSVETGGGSWWDLSTPHAGRGAALLMLTILGLDMGLLVAWRG